MKKISHSDKNSKVKAVSLSTYKYKLNPQNFKLHKNLKIKTISQFSKEMY